MLKLQSIVSFLLTAILVPYTFPVLNTPRSLMGQERAGNRYFVNVSIDKIQILGKTGDMIGNGEFRLFVLSVDTTGKSSGTYCPGDGPITRSRETP